jgi:hypothetical protein
VNLTQRAAVLGALALEIARLLPPERMLDLTGVETAGAASPTFILTKSSI